MRKKVLAALATVTMAGSLGLVVPRAVAAGAPHSSGYEPVLNPADFVRSITNPYFPLPVGRTLIYRGIRDGVAQIDTVHVTSQTRVLEGITATAVSDVARHNGKLLEKTTDWYAQDKQGNVWYLGEDTATLKPDGTIDSREGTWRTGRHGAKAGIFMPANPKPGDGGWQEYYPGHAQDRYRILNQHTTVQTPAASTPDAMLIEETTPLEPGVVDHKTYVRGIGTVREETVKGGNEHYELISIRHR